MFMKKCKNELCDSGKPAESFGWCRRCYGRYYRNGDPNLVLKRGAKKDPNKSRKNRYEYVWDPERGNNSLVHRKMMAEHLGRPLLSSETVHHINGDGLDNRLENLELWSKSQPAGQRVQDKVQWAIETLRQYQPESLNAARKDS